MPCIFFSPPNVLSPTLQQPLIHPLHPLSQHTLTLPTLSILSPSLKIPSPSILSLHPSSLSRTSAGHPLKTKRTARQPHYVGKWRKRTGRNSTLATATINAPIAWVC